MEDHAAPGGLAAEELFRDPLRDLDSNSVSGTFSLRKVGRIQSEAKPFRARTSPRHNAGRLQTAGHREICDQGQPARSKPRSRLRTCLKAKTRAQRACLRLVGE